MITETDIFKTCVDVMGLADGKTRLTLEVQDKVGTVMAIAEVFTGLGLNIDSLITCKKQDGTYEIVVRGDFQNVPEVTARLDEKGYKVVHFVRIG